MASLEEEIEQNHYEKKAVKCFNHGRQEDTRDIEILASKFASICHFFIHNDEEPLVTSMVMKIVGIMSGVEFKKWHYECKHKTP